MPPAANQVDEEGLLVRRCQQGEPNALAAIRDRYDPTLQHMLLARGASPTEAGDILADLWSECVPGPGERPSLLEKFSGKCSLRGWLATVATNRWVDVKRREARRAPLERDDAVTDHDATGALSSSESPPGEDALVQVLADSLKAAFALCRPEAMLCLRLVYVHGLTQRELVRMLGWSESKVSRFLSEAMEQIQLHTLKELKRRDPWLELSWQDFVDLCENRQVGFL